jgi:hypothetical protein
VKAISPVQVFQSESMPFREFDFDSSGNPKSEIQNPKSENKNQTMPLLILIILIVALAIWWAKSNNAVSYNERQYLKRRGYAVDDGLNVGPPVRADARLRTALDSLSDLSPHSRQRAAQDLARICQEGQRDSLMFSPLVGALQDSDPSVRSAAADALSSLGDVRAVEALKQRLEIEDSIQTLSSLRKAIQRLEDI